MYMDRTLYETSRGCAIVIAPAEISVFGPVMFPNLYLPSLYLSFQHLATERRGVTPPCSFWWMVELGLTHPKKPSYCPSWPRPIQVNVLRRLSAPLFEDLQVPLVKAF